MKHYDYDDDVLMCATGAGFLAVECMTGIYRAFEEWGTIPGKVLSSSGSTLFASLYYSKAEPVASCHLVEQHGQGVEHQTHTCLRPHPKRERRGEDDQSRQ